MIIKPVTRRIALLALSLGIAGFALLKFIPVFIDTNDIKFQIEDGLNKSTGVHFKIKALTLEPTLFHGIQAHLNTTTITDIQHHSLGDIRNITVQIRYLPLLTRQTPEIAKVHLNHVHIPVGYYSLFRSLKLKLVKPKKTGFLNPAELKNAELLLTDYQIEDSQPALITRQGIPNVRGFRIAGKTLSIQHLQSAQPITLSAKGQLAYVLEPLTSQAAIPTASGMAKAKARLSKAFRKKAAPKSNLQTISPYQLFLELSPTTLKANHVFQPQDIKQLKLKLDGQSIPLNLRYRLASATNSEAKLISSGLDLFQANIVGLQLVNTLGFPIPPQYQPYRIHGKTKLNTQLQFALTPNAIGLSASQGQIDINNVALYHTRDLKTPLISNIQGQIRFQKNRIELHQGKATAQGLPFQLNGWYQLDTQQLDAILFGQNLNIDSLAEKAARLGLPPEVLKGRSFRGQLDVNAHLTGTLKKPKYKGLLVIRNGAFSDTTQGLSINRLNGKLAFSGAGFINPLIAYNGQLRIQEGKLLVASQGLNVNHFDGDIQFQGQFRPQQANTALPQLQGTMAIREASYQDPQTKVPITGIHGNLRFAQNLIHLENFRGLLGSAPFQVNGQLASDLKRYLIHITATDVNLPQLKREVLDKLPAFQAMATQINPYRGLANLDLTVREGLQLTGQLDVNALALHTDDPDSPLQVPHLSVAINGQNFKLADTTVLYGPVAAKIGGDFNTRGAYNMRLNTGNIPVSFVRDQQSWLESLSALSFPEIWNTAGDFSAQGTLSNQHQDIAVHFNQAGLSWAGGDFPLYNLNGDVFLQKTGSAAPVIHSPALTFNYGNSPMTLRLEQDHSLAAELKGMLSELTVNHFLVSHQSNASPYQPMPLRVNLDGNLYGLPGQAGAERNQLTGHMFVGLSRNFRQAYSQTKAPLSEEDATASENNATPAQSGMSMNMDAAPNILTGKERRDVLRNINAINAANTAFGAANNTVDIVRQTVGRGLNLGLNTLRKPGQFITQKVLERPHESVETQALKPEELPSHLKPALPEAEKGQAFLRAKATLLGNNLTLNQANLHLFEGGDIVANGQVNHLDRPEQMTYEARLVTVPEINLSGISQGAAQNSFFNEANGTFGADLTLIGGKDLPHQLNGWVAANRLEVPYLTLQDVTARVELAGETADIVVPSFKVPGVTARMTARSENVFELPIPLEGVQINGSFISIDSLSEFNNKVVKPILIDQVVRNYMRPWQQGDPTSAVQFRDGTLQVDELIYENVILSNLRSKLALNANSFMELTDTTLEAAGGKVNGYLSLSPNENSFTTLELNADGVKANALTRALLNVTNQIFGDLNGTIRFTTFGQSDTEMQKNANGTVSLKITNGRLPAIAKVETLLATANVFRGGVLGLNLNNLFRSLTFLDTNYFAELTGDLLINDQILYTQNLVSDGVNLDLLIQGSLRMDNGNANMLVNGRMSQNIAGKLGAFGNLSLGRLFSAIPALGNFGKHRPGLLGYLPGIGYVPGFGGPAGQFNRFQVRLLGQPDDPAAIQDFQWIRPQGL